MTKQFTGRKRPKLIKHVTRAQTLVIRKVGMKIIILYTHQLGNN